MLLNLSNHPSSAWSPEQMNAAQEQFGGVIDVSFPNIDPHATSEEVKLLVIEYGLKVTNIKEAQIKAIHIMGEMTFVHNFIRIMETIQMPCYASTTERTVLEEADGRKTVQFKFVQFRRYC
jgi:hypothetical protein